MSISFVWDSSWESIPTDQIPRGDIRNHIGQIKLGTRERMEVEHEWGPNSLIDDGSHIRGGTGVAARGGSVPVANLRSGELCVVDSGGDIQVWLYGDIGSGLQWNMIGTIDHAQLINRNTGDPHPIYMLLSGDNITPNALQMGGHILRMSALAGTPNRTFGQLLLLDHAYKSHTKLGSLAAIQNGTLIGSKIASGINVITGTTGTGTSRTTMFGIPSKVFFPELTVKYSGAVSDLWFTAGISGYGPLGITDNSAGGGNPYQLRYRTVN